MKVPKNAKIRASRVLEYVPQYDEELSPCSFEPSEPFAPVPNAMPAPSVEPNMLAEANSPNNPDCSPSSTLPSIKDVKVDLFPKPVDDAVGFANASEHQWSAGSSSSAPKYPCCPLGNGEPPKDQTLKQQATKPKHMRTFSPNNLFYPNSHIAKDVAMKVSHTKDGKADHLADSQGQSFEQLAADDFILAKGSKCLGDRIGGVRSHYVSSDMFSGTNAAYPLLERDAQSPAENDEYVVQEFDYVKYHSKRVSAAVNVPEAELLVSEGLPVFPVKPQRHQASFRGDNSDDLKPRGYASKDIPFSKVGSLASPSVLGPESHIVSDIVAHDLNLEITPGFKACVNRARHHADNCRAHFHNVVKKKQRQKVKKPSHLASTEPVKNDVDVEHHARVRRSEGISRPTSSSSSCDNNEFHRKNHNNGLELELLFPVISSPSDASVSSVIVSNQVVPESSDYRQVKPTGRTNRRHRKPVKNAFNANAKSIIPELACSPDFQKMSVSEHGLCSLRHDCFSRDNLKFGDESQCEQHGNHVVEPAEAAPPFSWASFSCSHTSPWQHHDHNSGLRPKAPAHLGNLDGIEPSTTGSLKRSQSISTSVAND